MAAQNINLWDGNDSALNVTERLGLEESSGMLGVGPMHYNTVDEIARLKEVLCKLVEGQ